MISYDDIKSGRTAVPVEKKPDANSIPSLIDRASKRLSEAKTSAEVLEAKAAAELALHYAKVTKAANESHADCLRIITRAEIRMASEIDRGQEAGEVAKRGGDRQSKVPASDNGAKLSELGVSRQHVNEWRKVAEAGEEKVEEAISEVLAEGRAPTKADIHRAAGIVKDRSKSDEDQQFSDLMKSWNAAGQGARARFLDAINSPAPEHKSTGHAPRMTGSDGANTGGDDVDGSASARPSGQVLGARPQGVECGVDVEFVERTTSGPDAKRAQISPSAATSADTAPEAPSPNPAGAVPHSPDPQNPEVDDGQPQPSANVPSAQKDIGLPDVGQDGSEPCTSNDEFAQQPVSAAQARNEPGSASGASVTFNNPRCQKPETCSYAHSKTECHDCFLAWAKRPREEQVRLWAGAIAAESEVV